MQFYIPIKLPFNKIGLFYIFSLAIGGDLKTCSWASNIVVATIKYSQIPRLHLELGIELKLGKLGKEFRIDES